MNKVTRREFLTGLCSKDSIKHVAGTWVAFKKESEKASRRTCDEMGLKLWKKNIKSKEET